MQRKLRTDNRPGAYPYLLTQYDIQMRIFSLISLLDGYSIAQVRRLVKGELEKQVIYLSCSQPPLVIRHAFWSQKHQQDRDADKRNENKQVIHSRITGIV